MNSLEDWTRLPKPIVPVSPEDAKRKATWGAIGASLPHREI